MKYILYILAGLYLISCGEVKNKETDSTIDHGLLEVKIDSLFNQYFNDNTPGAAILVSFEGKKIISNGYGLRDLSKSLPIKATTNMRSGSLAKQFTALGILRLLEQGKLDLKDSVYKYIPYPVFRDVTINQLISHTSGIQDVEYVFENHWESSNFPNNKDAIEWYSKNDSLNFKPGSKFEYNNGGYYVLTRIIEIVSDTSFREFMQNEIFNPIGMNSTSFIDMSASQIIKEKALCYERDSLLNWQTMEGQVVDDLVGAGGIYTNLEDYSKYVEALRDKKILTPEFHDLIFKPISMNIELHSEDMRTLKGKNSSYAMGWEVFDDMAVSAGLYYGVNNWSIFEFERPLTIVIFTNNDILFKENLVDKAYTIIDEYFKNYCQHCI
ncbi:MAG: beta-lactamase family protein [Cyclobacteriaceae bacterium]|nr:beta-lactamase family protein [Cyclobacteriaceae bacterium]